MKILYSIQATGNGHISRAKEILPYLKEYGEVDCMLSGDNSQLSTNDLPIKYRSKGLSFYYNSKGGIDYWKTILKFNPFRIYRDAKALPVEDYDIIINDYDPITSLACRLKKVKSVAIGNQFAFLSEKTPRFKDANKFDRFIGELILKHLVTATRYVAFGYKAYDSFIYNPIIRKSIVESTPIEGEHILVYLPQYEDRMLIEVFNQITNLKFHLFSKTAKISMDWGNVSVFSINAPNKMFDISLINCKGVITAGGFQLTSEALYLGKRLMCIPIGGQYEQLCNAAALRNIGVYVDFYGILDDFILYVYIMFTSPLISGRKIPLKYSTRELVNIIINEAIKN